MKVNTLVVPVSIDPLPAIEALELMARAMQEAADKMREGLLPATLIHPDDGRP